MIPLPLIVSTLSLNYQTDEDEIISLIPMVERIAYGFAKARGRNIDFMFVEECKAEARYILAEVLIRANDNLRYRFPLDEDRHKFIRMSVKYGLKTYFYTHKPMVMLSYLKSKGIELRNGLFVDCGLNNSMLEQYIALEDTVKQDRDYSIIEFKAMGNDYETIAKKVNCSVRFVKKILRRIKRKLNANRINGYVKRPKRRHRDRRKGLTGN